MDKVKVYCDITMTRELIVEIPEDATPEEAQRVIDEAATEAMAGFYEEMVGGFDDWYWGGENVETERVWE